ncbi:hypothetical protein HD553DRAFT_320557 [Filobasidium floriforme]|uniref:uncharacterized protein n=1 Tax=Filobasidium floriforme TaxID=5210 RepID=UPI001E8CCC82|nr:uncharacterized protein HD553DRAFT_320557 [Filobasidium floriforme]KAH8077690.1 hypothetical protein HD553DRAFT_320557 [Filobasidium floriforme]
MCGCGSILICVRTVTCADNDLLALVSGCDYHFEFSSHPTHYGTSWSLPTRRRIDSPFQDRAVPSTSFASCMTALQTTTLPSKVTIIGGANRYIGESRREYETVIPKATMMV